MAGGQEKTEKPTGKKLSEARKRGSVAKSNEMNAVAVLLAGGFAFLLSGRLMSSHFRQLLDELWGRGFHSEFGFSLGSDLLLLLAMHFFIMITPVILSAMIIGVAVNLFQTKGFLLSFKAIQPKFSKLNPLQGIKKLFSLRSLVELGKSLFKISIIGYSVYGVLSSEHELLLDAIGKDVADIAALLGHIGLKILVRVCGIMLALSLLDFYYQRWQYEKDMKMTKQEVKEEHKQSEGNPVIKSRIRSAQRSFARKRMMSNISKATVVITNPTHYAVAILYDSQMEAPKVVAKGVDFLAQNIIKVARKHGVPVMQNPPLARALYQQVKLEGTIPLALYKAVAKVLAYIYRQKSAKSGVRN